MRAVLSLVLVALVACADLPPPSTIESLSAALDAGASGSERVQLELELQTMLLDRAKASQSLADIDAFLARFPKASAAKDLRTSRVDVAFAAADAQGTAAGWQAFLEENKEADANLRRRAKGFADVLGYGGVQVGAVQVEPWNLADDPKGPKNCWKISTTVTNAGDKSLSYLAVSMFQVDAAGQKLGSAPAIVVGQAAPRGLPIEEMYKKPLAPGKSREVSTTIEAAPEGWDKASAKVVATAVRFEGDVDKK